jgi:hypothetical protein
MRWLGDLFGDLSTIFLIVALAYAVAAWALGWWLPTF